jgi:DNA invertase Pin-like site-specific DNA recombinase
MQPRPETSMPQRAYSYIRFSSREQARGESYRRQLEFAEEVCRRRGWCLDDTLRLEDLAVSGFRGLNAAVGALSVFLEGVRKKRITAGSVLIVESLDRLSRETVDEAYDLFRGLIRAGITTVTREPAREYSRENCGGNMLNLLEPLFIMARAHEESAVKSMRTGDAWKRRKQRARTEHTPWGQGCPAWIVMGPQGYELHPIHARTVQTIYRWSCEGLGAWRIMLALRADPETFPPMGRSKRWNTTYVQEILRNRTACGYYEPGRRDEAGRRRPDGEAVAGYYPAAVTEETWYLAQAARKARDHKTGHPGLGAPNLFTGIAFAAETGCRLEMFRQKHPSGEYCYLGAYKDEALKGLPKSALIPYGPLERAVRGVIGRFLPRDVAEQAQAADEREGQIAARTGELAALDHRAQLIRNQLADPGQNAKAVSHLLEVLKDIGARQSAAAQDLERLKMQSTTGRAEALGETQTLLAMEERAEGEERTQLREKIKGQLRWLLEGVWVLTQRLKRKRRILHVQLWLHGGRNHYFQIPLPASLPSGTTVWGLRNVDLRRWHIRRIAGDATSTQLSGEGLAG